MIDTKISQLKTLMGANSDADLSRKLRIDKSTISSWRNRQSVPEKYLRMLERGMPERSSTARAIRILEIVRADFSARDAGIFAQYVISECDLAVAELEAFGD